MTTTQETGTFSTGPTTENNVPMQVDNKESPVEAQTNAKTSGQQQQLTSQGKGEVRSILKTSKYTSPFEQSQNLRIDRNGNEIPGSSNKLQRPTGNRKNTVAVDPNSPMKTGSAGGATPKHSITFRDRDAHEKNKRVCDVYLVESYKRYNAQELEEDTIICRCAIF